MPSIASPGGEWGHRGPRAFVPRLPTTRMPTDAEVIEYKRRVAIARGYTGDPCAICAERKVRFVSQFGTTCDGCHPQGARR